MLRNLAFSRHAAAESAIAIKTAARHVGGHGSGMA